MRMDGRRTVQLHDDQTHTQKPSSPHIATDNVERHTNILTHREIHYSPHSDRHTDTHTHICNGNNPLVEKRGTNARAKNSEPHVTRPTGPNVASRVQSERHIYGRQANGVTCLSVLIHEADANANSKFSRTLLLSRTNVVQHERK